MPTWAWAERYNAGDKTRTEVDITSEAEFPWRAYLSFWPEGAAVYDNHCGIVKFSVVYLLGDYPRCAFLAQCRDGHQDILEPGRAPSEEGLACMYSGE